MNNLQEITLKPELREFITNKIAQGKYQTLNEAINKGLELLKFQEEIYQGRFEDLQREIMLGVEASERGEVIDSKLLFSQLEKEKILTRIAFFLKPITLDKQTAIDQLRQTMDEISRKAIERGLTPEILEEILNEDE